MSRQFGNSLHEYGNERWLYFSVMAGLVPAIHVNARVKPAHDEWRN
jgi:hypothetical protein